MNVTIQNKTNNSDLHKYSVAWGMKVAGSLMKRYRSLGADFKDKRVLDFGCAWGYLCLLIMDEGACTCVGVDILPHWNKIEDQSLLFLDGMRLICGDLLEVDELQSMTFDTILSSGTLFLLDSAYLDKVLEWFCVHLVPGGEAFLVTRCVTAKSFNDIGSKLSVPGAQLLFSRRAVNKVLTDKGELIKSHLGYTGATWIMACRSAGFEVVNVRRYENAEVVATAAAHTAKTHWLNQLEIATGEIALHLRKPFEYPDLSGLRLQEPLSECEVRS